MTKKEREEIEEFLSETRKLWRASQDRRRVYYDGRIDSLEWVLRMDGSKTRLDKRFERL